MGKTKSSKRGKKRKVEVEESKDPDYLEEEGDLDVEEDDLGTSVTVVPAAAARHVWIDFYVQM